MGEAASSILDGDQSSIPDRDQPETSSIPHSNLPAPMPDHASNLPAVIAPQRLAPRLGGQLLAKQLLAKDGKGLEATGVHGAVIAATRAAEKAVAASALATWAAGVAAGRMLANSEAAGGESSANGGAATTAVAGVGGTGAGVGVVGAGADLDGAAPATSLTCPDCGESFADFDQKLAHLLSSGSHDEGGGSGGPLHGTRLVATTLDLQMAVPLLMASPVSSLDLEGKLYDGPTEGSAEGGQGGGGGAKGGGGGGGGGGGPGGGGTASDPEHAAQVDLLQIYLPLVDVVLLVHVCSMAPAAVRTLLGPWLNSESHLKVLCDCRADAEALSLNFQIRMRGVIDVQGEIYSTPPGQHHHPVTHPYTPNPSPRLPSPNPRAHF